MVASQQLPAKEQGVFRSIVKFYETKQYKKGVKAADSILKKFPEHGETLCMKGLALSYLDKKEDAYALVRKGLRCDLKSHVCWHVFGLLYRQDQDFHEASKCYLQALKFDVDNIQILRDLSLLQIHRRDLNGFAETRRRLLQSKPSARLNWIGYAVAEHLCENYEFAWTSIDNYEKTFMDDNVPAYENSELYLYKATIMEEAGRFEDALETLKQHESKIVDKIGLLEMKGRLCMFLKRYSEASDIYKRLIRINPEHHVYILAYMANQPQFHRFWPALPAPVLSKKTDAEAKEAESDETQELPSTIASFSVNVHPSGMPVWGWLAPQYSKKAPNRRTVVGGRQHKRRVESYEPLVPLTDEEEELVLKFFDELQEEFPKADSLKQLILFFLSGQRFQKTVDKFMRARIRKGVPSLFRMMRPLCFQPGKAELIGELLLQYTKCLAQDHASFDPTPSGEEEEAPSSLLFALMVTADYYDFMGDTSKALEYCNAAIAHTPTLVELYACKGRIYKHAGDLAESAKWFDEARSMDLADRFLNTQCAKSLIRMDDTQNGMEKALMFSKDPDSVEATNLFDMQCMWFESAMGRSFTRQGKYGKALKKFNDTFKHFKDIAEDQFDFHNYCLRKTTLKAYVGMLRMQERLYSHKFYRRAAKDAIKIHVELYDKKMKSDADNEKAKENEPKEEEMSAAEKKKMKHKLQREKKKAEDDKAAQQTAVASTGKAKKADEDPNGEKFLEKDQMEQAVALTKTLACHASEDTTTHLLTYDVFSRQGRLLPCLHALLRLWNFAGCDNMYYKLIAPLAHFCFVLDLESSTTPDAVKTVVMREVAPLLGGSTDKPFDSVKSLRAAASKVIDAVEKRMKETKDLPVIEVLYSLKCLKNAGRDTKAFLEKWRCESVFSVKDCQKMLSYLESEFGKDSSIWQNFKKRSLEVLPMIVIS
eukprot:TRINITY_DN14393_c0_g2_i1.p1 TRINITY_DN14393_c0_g2~~TRINITY_DN14393_c0_g2_i1.p1  ORF type:complete len:935 (-),score=227.05 TRINITY_DN14393_c0_g2_i1:167-2971(-)